MTASGAHASAGGSAGSSGPADSPRSRVLLVDDDETIREHLGGVLSRSGLDVHTASNGAEALDALEAAVPDLVILDVMMPIMDGREALRKIRERNEWLPVILLTQVGESFERASALDEGADDYLNKPFDPHELLARIRAVLRRSARGAAPLSTSTSLSAGDVQIDRTARRVFVKGKEEQLTPRAFALLEFLMAHPGEVFTRERLLQTVWGFDALVTTRAVDHRVAEIRKVLGSSELAAHYIETMPSMGYRFAEQVERS